jgi:chromosome partitioning protein
MYITVTSHKGGVGKTTSTWHLAAYFAEHFGEGSTVVVDTDPNASALRLADRAARSGYALPFGVVGPDEERDAEHVIFDSPGRLYSDELEAVAEVSDLVVVPTAPQSMSVDILAALVQDIEEIGVELDFRVLLTMVPWWNVRGGQARAELKEVGVPLFDSWVRFRPAFDTAAEQGVPVYEVKTRGARQGWRDYAAVGAQVVGEP